MAQGLILESAEEHLAGHLLRYVLFCARGEYGIAATLDGAEYAVLPGIGCGEEFVRDMFGKIRAGVVFPENLAEVVYDLLVSENSP